MNVASLDVVSALVDEHHGLTELGDPHDDAVVDEAAKWSPVQNLPTAPRTWPAMLLRAGMQDEAVPFWGPAMYVAVLRHLARLAGGRAGMRGHVVGEEGRVAGGLASQPLLLQVLAGGHDCCDSVEAQADQVAFLLQHVQVLGPGGQPDEQA